MARMRTLVSALTLAGSASMLGGCLATTPSYYSERVSGPATSAAVVEAEPTAARRRVARGSASARSSANAVRRGEADRNAPIGAGTTAQYSARPTATDGSSASLTREEIAARDKERFDRREQAIRRSLDSICRGC